MSKNIQKKIRLLQSFMEGRVGPEVLIDKMNSVPTWVAVHYKNEDEIAKHYEHCYGKVKVIRIGDRYYLINPERIHEGIYWFENDPIIEIKEGDPRENFME